MTGTVSSNSTDATLPLPRHALTLQYLRLRAIAFFIQVPLRFVLALGRWFRDPSILRKYQVSRRRILIPSRQKGRVIKVDIYAPIQGSNQKQGPVPVHINWHGSGFVLPCFGADTELCSFFASQLGCLVFDSDYRKAPQNPFPAGPQDAEDVCLYVLAHPELYDAGKISIGGCSAGAGIALAVGAKLGPEKIGCVCSIAPPTDFRHSARPKKARDPGRHRHALPPWASLYFDSCYLVINSDRSNPLLSPICAPSSSFPHTVYIATGTGDTLYHDGERLVQKLQADGHPSAHFRPVEGVGHAFEKMNHPDDWAHVILEEVVGTIRKSWSQLQTKKISKM